MNSPPRRMIGLSGATEPNMSNHAPRNLQIVEDNRQPRFEMILFDNLRERASSNSPSLKASRKKPVMLKQASDHTFDERAVSMLITSQSSSFDEEDDENLSSEFSISSNCSAVSFNIEQLVHKAPSTTKSTQSVNFNDSVQVREHAVTVGDAAQSHDSCPLTLDWMYNEHQDCLKSSSKEEHGKLRRLETNQRRHRIASVQGWTTDQVRSVEIERVLDRVQGLLQKQGSFATLPDDPQLDDSDSNDSDEAVSGIGLKVVEIDNIGRQPNSLSPRRMVSPADSTQVPETVSRLAGDIRTVR